MTFRALRWGRLACLHRRALLHCPLAFAKSLLPTKSPLQRDRKLYTQRRKLLHHLLASSAIGQAVSRALPPHNHNLNPHPAANPFTSPFSQTSSRLPLHPPVFPPAFQAPYRGLLSHLPRLLPAPFLPRQQRVVGMRPRALLLLPRPRPLVADRNQRIRVKHTSSRLVKMRLLILRDTGATAL